MKNVALRANRQTEREEVQGQTRPGPRAHNHSHCQSEDEAEGKLLDDHTGECTGRGGVQGTEL